jgi:hypothetical protein
MAAEVDVQALEHARAGWVLEHDVGDRLIGSNLERPDLLFRRRENSAPNRGRRASSSRPIPGSEG